MDDALPRAFISYRKDDTKQVARSLYSELKRVLERGEVFLDQREIEPGASFPETLTAEIERAAVVLLLIGPQWLTLQSSDGVRRLDEPDDWVRKEIELALFLMGTTCVTISQGWCRRARGSRSSSYPRLGAS